MFSPVKEIPPIKYIKKIKIFTTNLEDFDITLSDLITSKRINEDFTKLISRTLFSKIDKAKNYETNELHILVYTDFQTDIEDGPTFKIIEDFLKSITIPEKIIKRIYLFLNYLGKIHIFDFS